MRCRQLRLIGEQARTVRAVTCGRPAPAASRSRARTPVGGAASAAPDRVPRASTASRRAPRALGVGSRAYVALTKPRIIELLLVTTLPSMVLAARRPARAGRSLVATMVGGTLAAGSANALNCYVDRDIDARHAPHRAPPAGPRTRSRRAARWSSGSSSASIAVGSMACVTNWLAGGLTAASPSRSTSSSTRCCSSAAPSQNIVWGGAAGCMPVLIGWTAVTGSLAWAPVVALRASCSSGRRRTSGRWPSATARTTRAPACRCCRWSRRPMRVAREIVVYSWLTVAASLALWPLATGWVYGVLAGAGRRRCCSSRPTGCSPGTRAGGADAKPMQLFHLSNSYLAFVFVAVAVDTFVR